MDKILVVDDNKDLLQIMQIILKGQGYHTVLASSVQEAEHKMKIHKPVLVLLDVLICDADGREFCDRIKHDAQNGKVKVIMMSGQEENIGSLAWFGADDFLPKPFDYQELINKVQQQFFLAHSLQVH